MTIITLHHLFFGPCVNSSVIVLVLGIFLWELRSLRKMPWPKTITSDFHTMTSKKMVRSYYCLKTAFSHRPITNIHPFHTPPEKKKHQILPGILIFALFCSFTWFCDRYHSPPGTAISVKTLLFPLIFFACRWLAGPWETWINMHLVFLLRTYVWSTIKRLFLYFLWCSYCVYIRKH